MIMVCSCLVVLKPIEDTVQLGMRRALVEYRGGSNLSMEIASRLSRTASWLDFQL